MRSAGVRALALVATCSVVTSLSFAAVPGGAGAVGAFSSAGSYIAVPFCAAPKAGHAQCFAMRRERVATGTRGARAVRALPATVAGPAGGYRPSALAVAYSVNPAAATTETVAIIDAFNDPNALADLNVFDAKYGLPTETATSLRILNQSGASSPLPAADTGWAGEISLDLDTVRGLCNKCKIMLVEANSSSSADLATAVNTASALGAGEISNSYGGAESGPIPAAVAAAYNHPGKVIIASTGDHGYYDWDHFNVSQSSSSAPQIPSSLSTVVAVGGTTLYLNDNGTRAGESVWNENGTSDLTGSAAMRSEGAAGGGCSTVVAAARWQQFEPTGCASKRGVADVAALADPYTGYDIYDSYSSTGWQTSGGTSLAAPLIAALWALAGGGGGVTYPALSLYGHFKTTPSVLNDIVTGGNGICGGASAGQCASFFGGSPNTFGFGVLDCAWLPGSATLSASTRPCDAQTGYDGPSGVGTPKGTAAFIAMNPTAVITPPSTITHGVLANFSGAGSTDPFPGGTISTYAWTWGDGSTTTGPSATAGHTYATAGTKTVTLKITDVYGRTRTISKNVAVG